MLQSFHCDTSTGLELTGVRGNDGVGLIWFSVPRISEIQPWKVPRLPQK
jgi:hypothetical protein